MFFMAWTKVAVFFIATKRIVLIESEIKESLNYNSVKIK